MDMLTAAKAASLFADFEKACVAIAALETERPLYFFTTGEARGMSMPNDTRAELIRYFRKVKQACQSDIEFL